MKIFIITLCSLLLLGANLLAQPEREFGLYILRDFQYYRPLVADIRRPQFYTRVYYNHPVKFSNLNKTSGRHLFWDVGYGGYFPMVGYNFKEAGSAMAPMTGVALFMEPSAHMLLDFSTPSADVLNTDFRIGAGLAARLPKKLRLLSLRYKFFHESTHVGDEYILNAVADAAFRRYNVSYEAHEIFAGVERKNANRNGPAYWRLYTLGRLMRKDFTFDDFRDSTGTKALKTAGRGELQLGGEIFFNGRVEDGGAGGKKKNFWREVFGPQYWLLAADFYRRDKYALADPQKIWCYNVMAGAVYGNYFAGERSTKLLLNYYAGVNPHGQFRMFDISYLGLTYSVDF